MKTKLLHLFFISFLVALSSEEYSLSTSSFQGPSNIRKPQIMINNHPLAKVNGKTISLIDVVKKMDIFLYDYDPNIELSITDKVQFYISRWEETLEEMICNELVILDAKQKEIEANDGEIREELEQRFGPNIVASLDQLGLSYNEASEWIRSELMIRQMMWYKVHSKVLQIITPQVIKDAYQNYLEKNPPVKHWTYRVLTVRGTDKNACEELTNRAYDMLSNRKKTLEEVQKKLKEKNTLVTITLSDELSGDTPNISKQHYEAIKNLSVHTFSTPVSQLSRFDKSVVSRIFYLDSFQEKLPASFDDMHDRLKNKLLNETADKEKNLYFNSLKKRYGFDKVSPRMPIADDYQPFMIY